MRPVTVTVGPLLPPNPNLIAVPQQVVGGQPMVLTGPPPGNVPVTLDHPRQVQVTYGNELAQRTLLLSGTNWSGAPISETIIIPQATPGTVASVLDYATVISAVAQGSAVWTSPASLGTNTTAGSAWVYFDAWGFPDVSIQCTVAPPGGVTYTVQQTLDDPNSLFSPVPVSQVTWVPSSDSAVVNATSTQQSNYGFSPVWGRVLVTLGQGTVTATFWQAAVYPQ